MNLDKYYICNRDNIDVSHVIETLVAYMVSD
jgi:hypothetical protein